MGGRYGGCRQWRGRVGGCGWKWEDREASSVEIEIHLDAQGEIQNQALVRGRRIGFGAGDGRVWIGGWRCGSGVRGGIGLSIGFLAGLGMGKGRLNGGGKRGKAGRGTNWDGNVEIIRGGTVRW